ncbi:uracil-DNA glycosylase [Pseudoalteromonas luteoviolacea S2607]|uniref:uracil-DNA glycosylase n=1 Tax=Pseudoalteromonas luteoviolacea TaxID=43657 RepID=UPI0007B0BC87|nr:uracil-DNA glycosylase [Pseudoalteromonas luteoviolacea]KZN33154.1 uracil-DNA glycosylase [Pseudoalteromonas luteoviolacea S2607]
MTTWRDLLGDEKQQSYFQDTMNYVAQRRAQGVTVYPPEDKVFEAFKATELEQVKVVILGQDPYHGPNQAHGLCFSVMPGVKSPPSLANMYKELAQDIPGFEIPNHGYLLPWAEQGVLLLNTVLTVEQGQAHSHKHLGWEHFTDVVIEKINTHCEGVIFLLWGSHAQKKGKSIDSSRHHVLRARHPSPLSAHRGFFGCKHFSQANAILQSMGKPPINWQV